MRPAWRFSFSRQRFLVDESSTTGDDGVSGASGSGVEKRRRIVEFTDLTITNAGKLSYKGTQGRLT